MDALVGAFAGLVLLLVILLVYASVMEVRAALRFFKTAGVLLVTLVRKPPKA